MNATTSPVELHAIEKLREDELEEARTIQSLVLPEHALRVGSVTISHEFPPVAAVGGDFLDYFKLMDGTIGLYLGMSPARGYRRRYLRAWPLGRCEACIRRARHRAMFLPL